MIKVTRLTGKPFYLNALQIELVESFPDTAITLTNGRKFIVQEKEEEVIELMTNFYREIGLLAMTNKLKEQENE
ncbi:flagellar FlbD family protein [Metabacillus sp. KIGAM252]|uniref:Flagellar FlbD family protein n=1 Tax=Metabacillus flavus TaxID=2823519 RepID=A0ABS5LEF6_9BACI|nr:flagellar FlbD family protein [Metabacillus flavus]MBS2968991.1 flagellar FlbD family protein [Metabacillus flavus]